jgi:hypothetical protein
MALYARCLEQGIDTAKDEPAAEYRRAAALYEISAMTELVDQLF